MSQIQTNRGLRTIFLGIYYPGGGVWGTLQQTLQLERRECESAGLLYFNGLCFNISENSVTDIFYEVVRRETDGVLQYHFYAVLQS